MLLLARRNVEDKFINVSDLLITIDPELYGLSISEHGCAEDDAGVVRCVLP